MTDSPWLPLLRGLTGATRTWAVWKSPSALGGEGDVDAMAAEAEWPIVLREFDRWAATEGLGPIVRCTHFPGLLILVACAGERPTRLLQLDVYSRHLFRGATLATAEELAPLTGVDERGFRRLRPGAEGLLVLVRGLRRGGRPPADREELVARLCGDPEGAARLARLIGLPARALGALENGIWDHRAMLALELRAAARLLVRPAELGNCIALDYRRLRGCSLVDSLQRGRRVDGDRRDWLARIHRTHRVDEVAGSTS